jgi:hypothetical protein
VETRLEVTVELADGADQIAGRVRQEDGPSRRFTGYVGLLAAIDAVVAAERESHLGPGPSRQAYRPLSRRRW